MNYVIAGLGNPGPEYENTRHNAGRIVLANFRKESGMPEWSADKKLEAAIAKGKIGKHTVTLLCPETFMNKSGKSIAPLVKTKKEAERLIVIYDDLDLPFGKMKISFNRSSGGHKGLESIIRAIKTEAFIRIRIGISPTTLLGKMKKPSGDKAVQDFILGKFNSKESEVLKKLSKTANQAIAMIIEEGREKAMGEFNK